MNRVIRSVANAPSQAPSPFAATSIGDENRAGSNNWIASMPQLVRTPSNSTPTAARSLLGGRASLYRKPSGTKSRTLASVSSVVPRSRSMYVSGTMNRNGTSVMITITAR
jgi:hypothetical protein